MRSLLTRITPPTFLTIFLATLLWSTGPAAAQQLPMWTCADGSAAPMESFLGQDVDCVMYEVDPALACGPMCGAMAMEFNNMGFRSIDGRIYGLELIPGGWGGGYTSLIRINPRTCLSEDLGLIAGLPSNRRYDAGDISPDGRWMFINFAGISPFYVVDLMNLGAGAIAVPFAGATGYVHDWAYNPQDGLLYGCDTVGQVARVDLAAGPPATRSDRNVVGLPGGIAYGAAWFRPNGKLVCYRNEMIQGSGVGGMYVLDISNWANPILDPLQVPNPKLDVGSVRNDAATCIDCGVYAFQETDCHLVHYEPTGTVGTCGELCGDMKMEINNAGYWQGYIWAVELTLTPPGNNGLVRIDPAAGCASALTYLGNPIPGGPGLSWDSSQRFDAGDVTREGYLLVQRAGISDLFVVDLNAGFPILIERKPVFGDTGYVHDWAYDPATGWFFGGDTAGQLAVLIPNIGMGPAFRFDIPVALPPGSGSMESYGAAWFAPDGQLVLHRNDGALYRVDLNFLTVTGPVYGRNSTGYNDAARCTGWMD